MPDTITTAVPQQTPPQDAILHPAQVYFLSRRLPGIVHLVQYDQSLPYLAVELYEGDEPYTVPDGAAVNIRMAKPVPSTKKVYNPAYGISSDRHTVYIAVTPQMTVVAGCTNPVIEVVVDGGIACTGTLRLEIDPNPVQESDLIDTDEYKTLEEILAEAQAAAQIVQDNEQALQDVHNNLEEIRDAPANAQAAAKSAEQAADSAEKAQQEAQKAIGFRTFYGGEIIPDANGDLDPSRPMATPTAASVTIKARGDRIAGLTMAGKTTQKGTGDPSPDNIRVIHGIGWYDALIVWDGSSDEAIWSNSAQGAFFTDFPASAPEANWYISNPAKSNRLSVLPIDSSIAEQPDYSIIPNHPAIGQRRIIFKINSSISTISDARAYLADHPLYFWYHSKDYYKSKGPFYTVVELSDDPYRAVGFELTQPLFDGDSLKVGGKSGCDQCVVLDGTENWTKSGAVKNTYFANNALPVKANSPISDTAPLDECKAIASHTLAYNPLTAWANLLVNQFSVSNRQIGVRVPGFDTAEEFKEWLSANPLTVFYRSVDYTEENDIPVALEKHTRNYLIFDGTEVVTATTSGNNTPYLQIAGVAANYNSSHRLVSSVAPFAYAYDGAGAFADDGNIVFGKAWCQSNGFANTETMVKDFKSFLTAQHAAGTPVQVVYELATPVSYARPVPTMIAQPGEDGTFTVTGENSLSVLLKAFQDGGDAATLGGQTLAQINDYNASTYLTKKQLLTRIYPVGSIYMSANATDPGTLFGGTWTQIQGRFLLAADGSHAAGSTGGEATHTLTQAEMPQHFHTFSISGAIKNVILDTAEQSDAFGLHFTSGVSSYRAAPGIMNNTGGNQPHNNMPPYLSVYVWQRTA